jgi:glycosyltransferase involved in cell wall biosynthesis
MPVYNGMPYLSLAVESILAQSFSDFEFIIVNDCSTDNSLEYLREQKDKRIVLVNLEKNVGVTGALQAGMQSVRGEYIARLDADDIAKPERLARQVDYLDQNPDVGLLGSSFDLIDSTGKFQRQVNLMKDDVAIRWKMLFKNPFFHSTVMFRHHLIKTHKLDYVRKHGEDYQLWADLLQYCKGAITGERLIQYRTHQQSWTFTKSEEQKDAFGIINTLIFERYLPDIGSRVDLNRFVSWIRKRLQVGDHDEQLQFVNTYTSLVEKFATTELKPEAREEFVKQKLKRLDKLTHSVFFFLWLKLKTLMNSNA